MFFSRVFFWKILIGRVSEALVGQSSKDINFNSGHQLRLLAELERSGLVDPNYVLRKEEVAHHASSRYSRMLLSLSYQLSMVITRPN